METAIPEEPQLALINTEKVRQLARDLAEKFDPKKNRGMTGEDGADAMGLFFALNELANEVDRLRQVERHVKRLKFTALTYMENCARIGSALAVEVLRRERSGSDAIHGRVVESSELKDLLAQIFGQAEPPPAEAPQPQQPTA